MVFFLFAAAQSYGPREGIPLEVISLILRRRWRKARQEGRPTPASQSVNVGYPYFAVCLLAAGAHSSGNPAFFWGLCALLAWGLWPRRSLRFSIAIWAATGFGYFWPLWPILGVFWFGGRGALGRGPLCSGRRGGLGRPAPWGSPGRVDL